MILLILLPLVFSYKADKIDDTYYLAAEYRTITGENNNKKNPLLGSTFTPFIRITKPYQVQVPNQRKISNTVYKNQFTSLDLTQNMFATQFGNFFVHDFALTKSHMPKIDISVPVYGEPKFSEKIKMNASQFVYNGRTREQINSQTGYLDLSIVYGQTLEIAYLLRSFKNGMMKTDNEGNLPDYIEGVDLIGDPSMIKSMGDDRGNENPGLIVMHTLFVRLHNLLAAKIKDVFPELNDEKIYQEARRRNIAYYQHVLYDEYLPHFLGMDVEPYQGYDSNINPQCSNEYASFAGRVYHTLIVDSFQTLRNDLREEEGGPLPFQRFPFLPKMYLPLVGVASIARGLVWKSTEKYDMKYQEAIREFSMGNLDLATMDMKRSEDHQTGVYNWVRIQLGLQPKRSFREINPDPRIYKPLEMAYGGNVNICHTMSCALAEPPYINNSPLGETISIITYDQFRRSRAGDRFWYEREFCAKELKLIKSTTMADLVKIAFDTDGIHTYIFQGVPDKFAFFQKLGVNCKAKNIKTPYKYPDIVASWDANLNQCKCQDPNSYFIASINKCACLYGYSYNLESKSCEFSDDKAYGDYTFYHKPDYKIGKLTSGDYDNTLPKSYDSNSNYYNQNEKSQS